MRASRSFAAGEEVLWEYGPKANHALMVSYGFAMPPGDNPHDAVVINMKATRPTASDALHTLRQEMLDGVSAHFGDAPEGAPPRLHFTAPRVAADGTGDGMSVRQQLDAALAANQIAHGER